MLQGDQGIGKSRWIRRLIPKVLKPYFKEWLFSYSSKDDEIQLSECFIISIDELDGIDKKGLARLKQLVTQSHSKVRRPYARFSENLPRRASFIASINNEQFLHDTTGNRRFWCFNVTKITVDHGIDMDMVFSQAYALYKQDVQCWPNAQEEDLIEKNNQRFLVQTKEEELISEHMEPIDPDKTTIFNNATEIMDYISLCHGKNFTASVSHIGRIMKKLGFTRVKHKGLYRYAIRLKVVGNSSSKRINPNISDKDTKLTDTGSD